MRHGGHGAALRPRRVQEEADRPARRPAGAAPRPSEEMIVLHPEHRFRLVEAQQRARHEGVDFAIGRVVLGRDLDQIGTRMQRRPQRRIGEALVIAEIVLRRHVDGRQRAGAERLDLGEGILVLRGVAGMAARADPDRAGFLDHRNQRRRQSSGDRLIGFCPRDAVGNDDDFHEIPPVGCPTTDWRVCSIMMQCSALARIRRSGICSIARAFSDFGACACRNAAQAPHKRSSTAGSFRRAANKAACVARRSARRTRTPMSSRCRAELRRILEIVEAQMQRAARRDGDPIGTDRLAIGEKDRDATCASRRRR